MLPPKVCSECGAEGFRSASSCPHCGAAPGDRASPRRWLTWIAALVLLGAVLRIAAAMQSFPVSLRGRSGFHHGRRRAAG